VAPAGEVIAAAQRVVADAAVATAGNSSRARGGGVRGGRGMGRGRGGGIARGGNREAAAGETNAVCRIRLH
jgi:hypothetical protein